MDDTLIRDLLTDLLAGGVAVLASPPDRQFVAFGSFAHDCEMVAASVVDVTLEPGDNSGRGSTGCVVIPVANLRLTVMRCYPTQDGPTPPTVAALTEASLVLADDAVALTGALLDRWRAGTLFPTAGVNCDRVEIGPLEPVGPGGGMAGLRLNVNARL